MLSDVAGLTCAKIILALKMAIKIFYFSDVAKTVHGFGQRMAFFSTKTFHNAEETKDEKKELKIFAWRERVFPLKSWQILAKFCRFFFFFFFFFCRFT